MPLNGVVVILSSRVLIGEVNDLIAGVTKHNPPLVLAALAPKLATPGIRASIGERNLGRVEPIRGRLSFATAGQVGGKLPVNLGVSTWVWLVPILRLGSVMIDVVEWPEGRDGAQRRCNPGSNRVSPGSKVLACGYSGADAGTAAVGNHISVIEVAVRLKTKGLNGHAVVGVFDDGDVLRRYTTVVTAPCLV